MSNETASIQARDYESVKDILLNKVPLLDQLQKHASLRKQWLISLYQVANEQHWHKLLASLQSPEVEKRWEEVNYTIEKCKAINDTNGILINRGRNTYAQLLKIMKGDHQQETLYNAKGSKQSTRGYLSVAKA